MKICDRHRNLGERLAEAGRDIEIDSQTFHLCDDCMTLILEFISQPDTFHRGTHAGGAGGLWGNSPEQPLPRSKRTTN